MTDTRDQGPPERYTKGDNIIPWQVIEQTKVGYKPKAGEVVMLNRSECSLDVMYHRGHLGNRQEDADRRMSAGMWLRELHIRLHKAWLDAGIACYHDAWATNQDISSQLPERHGWNLKCYLETKRAMGSHWRPLEAVCVMDRRYARPWRRLQLALDALADLRGI